MSWLNISGNLSSLANNVSSFTREVLTEATDESSHRNSDEENEDDEEDGVMEDDYDVMGNQDYRENYYNSEENITGQQNESHRDFQIQQFEDELNILNTEISSKNDQIYLLEQENSKRQLDYYKHIENLKTDLLEKEKDIEELGTKLQKSAMDHEDILKELLEKQQRELELAKASGDVSKEEDDWADDWGGGSEELQQAKTLNDSLSNEVMMKEIILNNIEEKMSSVSGKHVDVADFSTWFDDIIADRPVNENTAVLSVLRKTMKASSNKGLDADNPSHVEEWLNSVAKQNTNFREKIDEMEKVITDVETAMSDHLNEAYTIEEFEDWLKTVTTSTAREVKPDIISAKLAVEDNAAGAALSSTDDSAEIKLKEIESEIRDLDEEYEDFEISNFSSWLETIQGKIDDLEMEMLKEQETRDVEDQQRILDRGKLEELFNEKQNEIAMLKVELFNKDSAVHHPADDSIDSQTIAHLHEQLSEAQARCEGLQDELQCVQKRNIDLSDSQEEISDVLNQRDVTQNELKALAEQKQSIEAEIIDIKKKLELRERELETEQEDNRKVQEELTNYKLSYEQLQHQLNEYANAYSALEQQYYQQQTEYQTLSQQYEENTQNTMKTETEQLEKVKGELLEMTDKYRGAAEKNENFDMVVKTKDDEIKKLQEEINIIDMFVTKMNGGENVDGLWKMEDGEPTVLFNNLNELAKNFYSVHQAKEQSELAVKEMSESLSKQAQELVDTKSEVTTLYNCLSQVAVALDESHFTPSENKLLSNGTLQSYEPQVYRQCIESYKTYTDNLQQEKRSIESKLAELSKQTNVVKESPKTQEKVQKNSQVKPQPSVKQKQNLFSQYFGGGDDSSDPFGGASSSDPFSDTGSFGESAPHNEPAASDVQIMNGFDSVNKEEDQEKNNLIANLQQEVQMKSQEAAQQVEKISILENQCANLSQELQNQMQHVETITQQLNEHYMYLQQVNGEKSVVENSYNELSQELTANKNLIRELNEHLEQSNQSITVLSNEKESLMTENTTRLHDMERQSHELDQLRLQYDELVRLRIEESSTKTSHENQDQELRQQILELDAIIKQNNIEKENLQRDLQHQQDSFTNLSTEFNNANISHETMTRELQEEIAELQKINNDLRRAQQSASPAASGEKDSGNSGGGGGGMKFGVLKKKLKELEQQNLVLQQEIENLKQQSPSNGNKTDSLLREFVNELNGLQLDNQNKLVDDDGRLSLEPETYRLYAQNIKSSIEALQIERSALQKRLEEIHEKKETVPENPVVESPVAVQIQEEVFAVENVQELNAGNTDEWESWGMNFEEDTERKLSVIERDSNEDTVGVEEWKKKVDTLEKSLREEQQLKINHENEMTKLKTEFEELETKTKNDSKMIKKLRAKLQVAEKKKNKDGGNATNDATSEMKAEIEKLENNNTTLQTDLNTANQLLEDEKRKAIEEIDELQENISRLEQELKENSSNTTSQTTASDHPMKFGDLKRRLQELERLNETLLKEKETLQNQGVANPESDHLSKQLAEKTSECQYYYEESERLKSTLLSLQNDMQTIQDECYRLKVMLHDQQNTPTQEQQLFAPYNHQDHAGSATLQQQDQLHTLSLRLTEKTEQYEHLQQQHEYLNAKVLELQNDTSDLELIREECKQLKAMLVGKEHASRVDETITMLQAESKQLKQLLMQKDHEYQQLQKVLLEKENDVSDMELLRDECKQLKQMLMAQGRAVTPSSNLEESIQTLETSLLQKDEELRQKDAMLIEMQNSNSDMDLLREECKQLKVMLVAKNTPGNDSSTASGEIEHVKELLLQKEQAFDKQTRQISDMHNSLIEMESIRNESAQLRQLLQEKSNSNQSVIANETSMNASGLNNVSEDFSQNSFMVQVQQLEDLITEKDEQLLAIQQEIREKDELLQQKDVMLQQKDRMLLELQSNSSEVLTTYKSDFELLQNECRALKEMIVEKERMFSELQDDMDSANDALMQKNDELKSKTNDLNNTRLENSQLQEELTQSMAQDENIHILQTEYRNVEEQYKQTQKEYAECREKLFTAETHIERLKAYEEQYEQLKSVLKDREEALNTLQLQSSETSIMESETVGLLQQELNELKSLVYERETRIVDLSAALEKKNIEIQNICNESKEKVNTLEHRLKTSEQHVERLNNEKESLEQLSLMRHEHEEQLRNEMQQLINRSQEAETNLKETSLKCNHMENELRTLQQERSQLQTTEVVCSSDRLVESDHVSNTNELMLTNRIKELETELSKQRDELARRENIEVETKVLSANQETKSCNNCLQNNEERTLIKQELHELKTSLEIAETGKQQSSIITDLRTVQFSVDKLLDSKASLSSTNRALQALNTELNDKLNNQASSHESSFNKTSEDYEFKIKDLQSQLLELNEIQSDYETLRTEKQHVESQYEKLQDMNEEIVHQLSEEQKKRRKENELAAEQVVLLEQQLNTLQDEYQQRIKESEATANTVVVAECEKLRQKLEENSHAYLTKTKECDQLKLDILQLEEKLYKYEMENTKMKKWEEKIENISKIEFENQSLKSTLEDYQEKFESGKKEKAFLEELAQQKANLEQEKNGLLFQLNQLSTRVQEQDILLKHKEVQYREVEAKSTRELERLRNHLMMIEENHEKDILDLKDREDALVKQLDDSKHVLSTKSLILQDSNKQFQDHVHNIEEQLHAVASQRDGQALELAKCKDKIEHDARAIYNLQSALEQLEKEKTEQYDFLMSVATRKETELGNQIEQLTEEKLQAQATMSEASLAVQGIEKITLELQQKENELKISKEKVTELLTLVKEREHQVGKMMEASDGKLDKSLIRNLLLKYFQSEENKRADIVQVIGGLLQIPHEQIVQIGSGAVPSKVSGWISNVWGFATPKKPPPQPPQTPVKKYDVNQSFSELFVKFLENESDKQQELVQNTASLTITNDTTNVPNIKMFTPTTPPDILAFHNNKNESLNSSQTIPAPGQEIPRVHTHHAQTTLKTLLS